MDLNKVKLKVCGLKDPDNIRQIARLKPDFAGLIFYEKSPRYIGDEFDPEVLESLSDGTERVGIFVNEDLVQIIYKARKYGLDVIQLHGDESPEYCERLKDLGYTVIKVFSIGEKFDFRVLDDYEDYVDYFLFDTKGKYYGGNSERFDWEILKRYNRDVPVFLSGGISLEHVNELKQLDGLMIFAIDVNSRFEDAPGIKNVDQVKELIDEMRSTN